MTDHETRLRNRLSVKKVGVGMHGLDGVNQKVVLASSTRGLLINAIKNCGCVKINIDKAGEVMLGKIVQTKKNSEWTEKLDTIASQVDPNEPSYFVLFRSMTDCLIVTYVPDTGRPKVKMVYASSKEALKDGLLEFDANMQLEEFNVNDVADLNTANYQRKQNAPKPYSPSEEQRIREDQMEKGGATSTLARIMAAQQGKPIAFRDMKGGNANAMPLPLAGMSKGVNMQVLRDSLKPIGKTKVPRQVFVVPPITHKPAGQMNDVDLLNPSPLAKKPKPPVFDPLVSKADKAELLCEIEYDLTEVEIPDKVETLEEELEDEVRQNIESTPVQSPEVMKKRKKGWFAKLRDAFRRMCGKREENLQDII